MLTDLVAIVSIVSTIVSMIMAIFVIMFSRRVEERLKRNFLILKETMEPKWRNPLLIREIQLLNIIPSEKVLHLGCGAVPSATISIAKEKKTKVVGIDNNYIAIKLAQSYIKKKNLFDLVTIEYGDGTNYPIQDFDIIYIAINVWPIDKVLFHLAQTMKPTARILCKGSYQDVNSLL